MKHAARFRVFYAWWPVPEVRNTYLAGLVTGFEFTGRYYWRTRVNAVKNRYYGWIAFEDAQTPAHLERCPSCKQLLAHTQEQP